MILIGSKVGQLGNRLLLFAHFIANALEYDYPLANPSFDEYRPLFEHTRLGLALRFPARAGRLAFPPFVHHSQYQGARALSFLVEHLPPNARLRLFRLAEAAGEMDLAGEKFIALRRAARTLIVKGWRYRDHHNFWKHRETICRFFQPAASQQAAVGAHMQPMRRDGALLVGVHIRQGDYRGWADGQFFFTTQEYAALMEKVSDLFSTRKVRFLVCSAGMQDANALAHFDHRRGPGTPFQDLLALAACDYMIGPPSTFSGWASYFGKVPLFRIRAATAQPDLASFSIYGERP